MDHWAIIPAKPFKLGKSRLAAVLNESERTTLNQRLFEHVFDVAISTLGADRIIVVTADTELLAQVRRQLAHAIQERSSGDLNAALAQASHYASERGADAILILPSDLADITVEDIAALRNELGPTPCCAIAPDASGHGTNALALAPPSADFFRFGPQSFTAHIELAAARGIATRIVRRPGLAHDLDTPENYRVFASRHQDSWLQPHEDIVSS